MLPTPGTFNGNWIFEIVRHDDFLFLELPSKRAEESLAVIANHQSCQFDDKQCDCRQVNPDEGEAKRFHATTGWGFADFSYLDGFRESTDVARGRVLRIAFLAAL